jgi:hypothetical protein
MFPWSVSDKTTYIAHLEVQEVLNLREVQSNSDFKSERIVLKPGSMHVVSVPTGTSCAGVDTV